MFKNISFLKIYVIAVIMFLIFPLFIIVPMSFSQEPFLKFPPSNLGFKWYKEFLTDSQWMDSTFRSFRIAFASSILATACGTIAALGIDRLAERSKGPWLVFISTPIVLPHIFIALGVFLIALRLGATDSELFLIGAHATIALPFVILMVGAVVKQLDISIERAARILGASPARTFFSVLLPTLLPSIVAAAVVAFFISFDELIIALFLMGGNETLPMKLWANMRLDMSPIIAAVASILILVTTAGMFFAEWLRQRANKTLAVVE